MLASFSTLELIVYALIWAAIGGLPGFYWFASINRNPRAGARLGVLAGEAVGFLLPVLGLVTDSEGSVASALLLWIVILGATLVMAYANIGHGNHSQRVSMGQRMADLAYGLLWPTMAIVTVIIIFPMVWNLVLSLRPVRMRDLAGLSLFSLEGLTLDNYNTIFSSVTFMDTLVRTLVYTVLSSALTIVIGLIAALVVRDKFLGRNVVRGFMLFPYIAPIVSVVFIWRVLLNAQFGLVNVLVDDLGGQRLDYLRTPGYAFTMVILFQAWRYFPFAFLFILARLQAIPSDFYEAAQVDGASPLQRLRFITIPQLSGVFATLFLLRFIWTFNKFDDVFLLTGGAANTKLITIEIYDQLFSLRNVGTASAVAVVLAALMIVMIGIYLRYFSGERAAA